MAKTYPAIDSELRQWIEQQPMFFLASAPLARSGHVNVSPRGLDSLRIAGEHEVLILDLTGSGNETAAHLGENGRLTIMFCSFAAQPRILRLYGAGEVVLPDAPGWPALRSHFGDIPGVRQIFRVRVERIQTSCGIGVPRMELIGQRESLLDWAQKKGEAGLLAYREQHNRVSIDGLPAPQPRSPGTIKPQKNNA